MDTMTTVSEVLNKLKKDGYTVDFNLSDNCLVCSENSLKVHPDEFIVDKHYRFEGFSDPADEAIVYAISSTKHNIKGTLVNGYGIYSDEMTDSLINALKENTALKIPEQKEPAIMEKSNQATPQRPEGDRLLDAKMVTMDMALFKEQIKQEKAWKEGERNSITIFKSEGMRIVMIALHKGAEMKAHTAPCIISVQVLEGKISFHTENQSAELKEGQMLALHAGISHSVHAVEESIFLLTLSTQLAVNKEK
ncbi:quercetin dioxygenase-like cupin family protein [Pedobacter sp. UYP24]